MENEISVPFYKNRMVLIGAGVFIILILLLTFLIASSKKKTSPSPSSDNTNTQTGTSSGSSNTNQVFAYPKKYKDTTIDSNIFKVAEAQYPTMSTKDRNTYILDITHKYYSYRDVLIANNIQPPTLVGSLTFNIMQSQVLTMEQQIKDNLITSIDFVYIKARYRQSPNDTEVNAKFKDPQAKAKELIEKYKAKFEQSVVNVQQILNESNNDADLAILNFNEKNEFMRNYTVANDLLFNDKNFHDFLFSQKEKKVSTIYEPISKDGKPFGYMIVYPTKISFKPYYSIDQVEYIDSANFSY